MKFRIADIIVKNRKRKASDITSLAESIKQLGLLNPITIQPDGTLIAGLNRLEACKFLGWQEIDVTIAELDELHTELAEIDENIARNDLTAIQRAEQLTRRKQIYESIYPETKKGTSQARGMNKSLGHNVVADSAMTFSRDTAQKTGISDRTIREDIQIGQKLKDHIETLQETPIADSKSELLSLARMADEERDPLITKIVNGEAQTVKEAKQVVKRETLAEKAKLVILPPDTQLLHGDFREVGNQIADNSVSLIFTDPPYHEQYLMLWSDLGSFAARVLKPGGILLSYSGQSFLPQVLNALNEHLEYRWTIGVFHQGQHIQVWKDQAWNEWKPIVMFSKDKPIEHAWFIDARNGIKGDKEAHEWAQGENEASYYIDKLTQPGDLVVDPMCGSGPIVRMAHRFKRRAIGIEIDKSRYDVALGSMEVQVPA